ncbi:Clavaminate synthase-like protein [Gloeophyllum trabeum ATCC 11539]|uniref:Clavaminate synthase-like protein n=1 Tax=Gloeophyllum trabeum (strain ATCC 11539 / FP-39264 / Madison 617) TaxID=670483 RepID=S7QK05_GLOTA|nr:Clavaminate synthase-like protein [Gloeophyllum trabeum ATCC 11539]EPQ59707.1 Clavaminate synthase-like protein [Gloeophyllum trabeum ATCC 11539]
MAFAAPAGTVLLSPDSQWAWNPGHTGVYQNVERASVRLAARATVEHEQAASQPRVAPPTQWVMPYAPGAWVAIPIPHPMHAMMPASPSVHQPQPPAEKRPSADEEEQEQRPSKAKRSRAKSTATGAVTAGSSKRGFNKKRRAEAAKIQAHNAQFNRATPAVYVTSDQGRNKVSNGDGSMTIVCDNGVQLPEATSALRPELQFARCMSNRYKADSFPRCVSCTRRWAGDQCRFQGIRFFLKDDQGKIVGISFVESQKPDSPTMKFPERWNIELAAPYIDRIKRTVARALLPTLREEQQHLSAPGVIRRPRESDVRATCDTCNTSIFSSSWMCRMCGREACGECYEQVRQLTEVRSEATEAEVAAMQAKRERHAHSNPFFLACNKRTEHTHGHFSPMSRFCKAELDEAIKEMEDLLRESQDDQDKEIADPSLDKAAAASEASTLSSEQDHSAPSSPEAKSSPRGVADESPLTSPQSDSHSPVIGRPPVTLTEEVPTHHIERFSDETFTDDAFRPLWAKGEPLVVTGLLPKFQIRWTPEYFMEKYGSQACLIVECQTDQNKRVTVRDFFKDFGVYEGRKECWKLKDWPSSTEFSTAFPELFEDFSRAVPVPNYVRRDGVLNLASHFPSNTVAPDIGPKMYNAMASSDQPGSKGSTRLHMDMADALNIMTHAAPCPDGSPGCAVWDLFRAQDADHLRKFLKKKFRGTFQNDPIHSQTVYLDRQSRQELYEQFGVKSYRVYQKPGEAVFIPAGCAHQVCNLADCIKVAIDFVSPENVDRCETLTREFRQQNQAQQWKEDVLQLKTMMWFAWLSCCRQEKQAAEDA